MIYFGNTHRRGRSVQHDNDSHCGVRLHVLQQLLILIAVVLVIQLTGGPYEQQVICGQRAGMKTAELIPAFFHRGPRRM